VIYWVTAIDGLAFGLLLFVVAAGLTLIFGVMDVLNLAHGSFYLAGACAAHLFSRGSLVALTLTLVVAAAAGAAGGTGLAIAIRPLSKYGPLSQALLTLGLALLAADAYGTVSRGSPLPTSPPTLLAGSITIGEFGYPRYRLVFIAVAALLGIALHLVVARSRFGVLLRATVADPVMAGATGINTRRVEALAMATGGLLAMVAGVLGAPLVPAAPGVDNTVLVLSLIVVVIGGAGSVPGTLAGALLVGEVQTIGVLAAPTLAPFALFAALLAVLVVRGRANTAVTRQIGDVALLR
jgi:branched-subunit amino acid ABC-type transport system permease component